MKTFLIELKRLCVKSQYRALRSFVLSLCLVLVISLDGLSFVSLADVNDLMIGTGSNALMTLELDDSDYSVMPMSSIGSVVNTVDLSQVFFTFWVVNPNTGRGINIVKSGTVENNKISVKLLDSDILDGYYLSNMGMHLKSSGRDALPPSGTYKFSFDLSNQFSYSFDGAFINMEKLIENAQTVSGYKDITQYVQFSTGEAYCPGVVVDLKNVSGFYVNLRVEDYAAQRVRNLDGFASFRFELSSDSPDITVGLEQSSQNYQNDVSGSLSDLSFSVDTMTDEISGVTEAIQNLQGSMEPHYSNVLTQLHHITEQLHAFYDQVYNNIHLVELDILQGILAAIENMDLEVNVELGGLKQTIERVSSEVQANDNKLAAEQIANDEANTEEIKDAVEEHGNFIIDGLKGLFIPSDEFFKSYFDDLYEYFADRFGFLSFPIELVVRIADMFLTSEKVDAVLILPAFEISGYQVWEQYNFNFTEFLETSFPFLITAIQTLTSIGLVMAFVNLCQDKWNEVMKS